MRQHNKERFACRFLCVYVSLIFFCIFEGVYFFQCMHANEIEFSPGGGPSKERSLLMDECRKETKEMF